MRPAPHTYLAIVFTWVFAASTWAADGRISDEDRFVRSAENTDLSQFIWKKRPVVVFAESADDPAFIQQMDLLNARKDELLARDVVVITDTNPMELSDIRKRLRPRAFMLVILSKEGRVQQRKPFPWDVREISRTIDKLPIRQQEIRDAKGK